MSLLSVISCDLCFSTWQLHSWFSPIGGVRWRTVWFLVFVESQICSFQHHTNLVPWPVNKKDQILRVVLQYQSYTGKSFSEALILASLRPQYDKRLFIDFPEKIQVHNMYKNCFFVLFCFDIQNNICTQHVLNLYFRGIQFNSYCGLTDSRRSASDTDLPLTVQTKSAKCNCVQNSFNTWTETTKATTFICSWPLSECVGFWYMKKGRIKNT